MRKVGLMEASKGSFASASTPARIARAGLACALAAALCLPPLAPLSAFGAEQPPVTAEVAPADPDVSAVPADPDASPVGDGSEVGELLDPDVPADSDVPDAPADPAPDATDPPVESPSEPAPPATEPELLSDADSADALVAGDVWGGVAWSVDADGLLRLAPAPDAAGNGFAAGRMPELPLGAAPPWVAPSVAPSVRALQVEAGVSTGVQATRLFANLPNLAEVRSFELDTSEAISLLDLFWNCSSLGGTVDLSGCDTSRATNLWGLFNGCSSLERVVLGGSFSTASATTLGCLFLGCGRLAEVQGLGGLDTSNVTSFTNLFAGCSSLKVADVAHWDVSRVADMRQVFMDCGVERLDLSRWDTNKVENFFQMFYRCASLRTVDLGPGFHTYGVKNVRREGGRYVYGEQGLGYMFAGCSSLASLEIEHFSTYRIRNVAGMLSGCTSLSRIRLGAGFSWTGAWDPAEDAQDPDYDPAYFADMLPANAAAGFLGWRNERNHATLYPAGASGADIPSGQLVLRAAFKVEPLPAADRQDSGTCGQGVSWDLSRSKNELRIYPTDGVWGRMKDMLGGSRSVPWSIHWETKSVKVLPGVETTYVLKELFRGFSQLTSCDLSGLAVPYDLDVSRMFYGCSSLVSVNLSPLARVYNMEEMFRGCTSLASVDFSGVDTSRVTNMKGMFRNCAGLVELDASPLNTSQAATMEGMFAGCSRLAWLDVSRFDTSRATTLKDMFSGCAQLAELDVSRFYASQVTDMEGMFRGCASLASIDLSRASTPRLERADSLFEGCSSLVSVDLSAFDSSRLVSQEKMFAGCPLKSVRVGPKFNLAGDGTLGGKKKVVFPAPSGAAPDADDGIARAYSGEWHLAELGAEGPCALYRAADMPLTLADAGWDEARGPATWTASEKAPRPAGTGGLTEGVLWDVDADGHLRLYPEVRGRLGLLKIGDAPWRGAPARTARVYPGVAAEGCEILFAGMEGLVSCDLSGLDASRASSMAGMFRRCASLERVDLSPLDASRVEDMHGMFYGCASLESADLSPLDTSQVKDMGYLFALCTSLVEVGLAGLDTSRVESMIGMFFGCSSLSEVDLASLDTSRVGDMSDLFRGCASLSELDLTGLDTSSAWNMGGMFHGCTALSQLVVPDGFIGPKAYVVHSLFRDCPSLTVLPANLAIPSSMRNNYRYYSLFRLDPLPGGGKLTTYYAGDDPLVISYDWEGDNRELVLVDGEGAEEEGPERGADAGGAGAGVGAGGPGAFAREVADASAWQGLSYASQVAVAVPESMTLAADAAGGVAPASLRVENRGACAVELVAVAPRLADDALPPGAWTLEVADGEDGAQNGARDDMQDGARDGAGRAGGAGARADAAVEGSAQDGAALLAAQPFLKASEAAYELTRPVQIAPGGSLRLSWSGAFPLAEASALDSAVARAGGLLVYGTFEPTVALVPCAAAQEGES